MHDDPVQRLFFSAWQDFDGSKVGEFYTQETNNVKPNVLGGRYMSKRVLGFIKNKMHYHVEREYIFDNTRVSLSIFCINKTYNFALLYNVLNFYIYALNKVVHRPVVKLVLYLSNMKKLFPSAVDVMLNEDNVNSGVTFMQEDDRCIIIYRKEELFKVLLHELLHYYDIGFHAYDGQWDRYFIDKYDIHVKQPAKNPFNPLALYEAYTDALACYGHVLANQLFKGEPESISAVLEQERKHIMLQAAKVYKYGRLRENTHCFSYYIVKAALFHNWSGMIAFWNSRGLVPRGDWLAKFMELVQASVDAPDFWAALKHVRTRKILSSSLKMSKVRW